MLARLRPASAKKALSRCRGPFRSTRPARPLWARPWRVSSRRGGVPLCVSFVRVRPRQRPRRRASLCPVRRRVPCGTLCRSWHCWRVAWRFVAVNVSGRVRVRLCCSWPLCGPWRRCVDRNGGGVVGLCHNKECLKVYAANVAKKSNKAIQCNKERTANGVYCISIRYKDKTTNFVKCGASKNIMYQYIRTLL